MTLEQAQIAYPVGTELIYGVGHRARVVGHQQVDWAVEVIVEDGRGLRHKWVADTLAPSGVKVVTTKSTTGSRKRPRQ